MKNLTYLLLLFLALPFTGFSQNDSVIVNDKQQASFKNQIDLDFEILAFSLGYKHKVSEKWMLGSGFGIGPLASLAYLYYENDDNFYGIGFVELMHVSFVVKRYNENNYKWSSEIEPRLGITGFDEGRNYYALSLGYSVFYGGKIQIGYKISIGRMYDSSRQPFFISNNLILRLPKKW